MISIIPTYNLEVLEHAVGSLDNLTPDHFSELTDMLTDLYWYCTHTVLYCTVLTILTCTGTAPTP